MQQTESTEDVAPRHQPALAALLAMGSMSAVQLGAALAKPTMDAYGTFATTWGRVLWAAIILNIIIRPKFTSYGKAQWLNALALGAVMALMTLAFYFAITRVPLGMVVAIEFLGPLCVAMLGFTRSWRLVWPFVAFAGVLLLVRNREGWTIDLLGLAATILAGAGWGSYILLTKKAGNAFKGLEGLAVAFGASAVVATPFGLAQSGFHLPFDFIWQTIGLAVLTPLLPYALEMLALRRMSSASFGILMSAEPAIGALFGYLILHEELSLPQLAGIGLVIVASIGAVTSGQG